MTHKLLVLELENNLTVCTKKILKFFASVRKCSDLQQTKDTEGKNLSLKQVFHSSLCSTKKIWMVISLALKPVHVVGWPHQGISPLRTMFWGST